MIIYRCILLALLVAAPAAAQTRSQIERRYTPHFNECIADSSDTTIELLDCLGAEIDRQDARLNQAYVMVMHSLPASGKTLLRRSERAWIGQRDARCARAANEYRGGTLAGVAYSQCVLHETIKRIIFLENYRG